MTFVPIEWRLQNQPLILFLMNECLYASMLPTPAVNQVVPAHWKSLNRYRCPSDVFAAASSCAVTTPAETSLRFPNSTHEFYKAWISVSVFENDLSSTSI